MLEISPVLAGTFDSPDYAPAVNNIARAPDDIPAVKNIDPRRYTQFDRTATEAGETTDFSFSDLLDLVNPLQHIPLLSSVYRSATNESINPVSRVAGDILYGGLLGPASAILGGIGAAGDAIFEAETGKDTTGNVMALLFGTDKTPATTQLAENATTATDAQTATSTPSTAPAVTQLADTLKKNNSAATLASASTDPAAADSAPAAKGFPLNRNKLPYGGVMDPAAYQGQNAMLAVAQSSNATRMGPMIYTNPLLSGRHSPPVAPVSAAPVTSTTAATPETTTTATSTASAVAATPSLSPLPASDANTGAIPMAAMPPASALTPGPQKNPIPQNLIDDVVMMKALNQYRGLAAGPTSVGSNLDIVN